MLKKALLAVLICCSFLELHAQDEWKLAKDSHGVKVYTKPSENSDYNQVKGIIILDAPLESFVAIVRDLENFKDWGYRIRNVEILERLGDTVQVYYSVAKAPFPYKNRDGVYANVFSWDAKEKSLEVSIEMRNDYMEIDSDLVRINGGGLWKVNVLPNNKLEVILQMQMDPGGGIPAWLSNLFIEDSPYHTLKNLRDKIKDKKYQNQSYSFIQ